MSNLRFKAGDVVRWSDDGTLAIVIVSRRSPRWKDIIEAGLGANSGADYALGVSPVDVEMIGQSADRIAMCPFTYELDEALESSDYPPDKAVEALSLNEVD